MDLDVKNGGTKRDKREGRENIFLLNFNRSCNDVR